MKAEALKEQTTASRPIKALMVYPSNTPATLVPKLIVSRFTKMHDAHNVVQARCLELESELSKLHDKVQKDDHTELVKCFSNLEINHLNLQNNREVHLVYLKHLKESVETIREIGEEDKVERPLDRSIASACLYTKHSHELLEYVIGTCPKDFNQLDKKHAYTPLAKKKQVTVEVQCATSNSNTHKHVEQLNTQKTNVSVPPSTGVNSCTDASRSQPRSNTKKNRILPAKSVNKKNVEEHPRTNKSNLKTKNRVDFSISSKRTNGVVKRWNRTLIEAARTMLIFSKAPMFLWAKAVATAYKFWARTKSGSCSTFCTLTNKELDILFQPMFDEYLKPTRVKRPVSPALTVSVLVTSADTPSSTTINQDAPSPIHSPSSSALQSPSLHQGVAAESTIREDNPFAHVDNDPFINVFAPEPSSEASSSGDLSSA
ncbi:hypothetical protein Tco_0396248 [Tanacetum coccineum]